MVDVHIGAVRRARGVTRRSCCAAILTILAAVTAALAPLLAPTAQAQPAPPPPVLDLVSVAGPGGPPANGESTSSSVSADGRFVAFTSDAPNLAGGNPGGWHIYLHDRLTGATTRVSPPDPACPSCALAHSPSLSADARRVAYATSASYTPADAPDDGDDVYYQDIPHDATGAVSGPPGPPVLVSVGECSGSPCSVGGSEPSLSGDGNWIAFTSNYAFGYTPCGCSGGNDLANVFLAGLAALPAPPLLVSRSAADPEMLASGESYEPSVSHTGAYVAFSSGAGDLLPPPGFPAPHVYRWERSTGAVLDGSPGGGRGAGNPSIGGLGAAEGTRIAYEVYEAKISLSSPCLSGALINFANCGDALIAVDNHGGGALMVSSIGFRGPANGFQINLLGAPPCLVPAVLPPGAPGCEFELTAPNPGPTTQTAVLEIVHNALGSPTTIDLLRPSASASTSTSTTAPGGAALPGRFALAPAETNAVTDIYLTDLTNPADPVSELVSERGACPPAFPSCPDDALSPALSADGSTVAWESRSADFFAGDSAFTSDVFVRDLRTGPGGGVRGPLRRVPPPFSGYETFAPALSRDGAAVSFEAFTDFGSGARPGPAAVGGSPPTLGPAPPPTLGPPVPASLRAGPVTPSAASAPASPVRFITPQPSDFTQVYVAQYPGLVAITPPAFGTVVINQTGPPQTVTVTNHGHGPLTVTGVSSSSGEFLIVGGACVGATLQHPQSCGVQVVFAPTVLGARSATLTVSYVSGLASQTAQATLQGVGAPVVVLVINPSSIDFGTVAVGNGSDLKTVTITNQSGGSLAVGPRTVSGADGNNFTIADSTCGASLAPGASCTVTLVFTPISSGAKSGQLNLSFGGQQFVVSLTGTGGPAQPPAVEVTPQPLTWGDIAVGSTSAPKDLTVKNTGAGPLNVATVNVTAGGTEYKITGDDCSGKSLANGQSCRVTLTFTPSALGDRTGELTITSNAGQTKAALGGKGVAFAIVVDPNPVDFGSVPVDEDAPEKVVTITIAGVVAPPNGSFSITGPNASDFRVNSRECSAALPDGTKCTVRLGFKPAAVGERTATLQGTFGPSQAPFSVPLLGAGGVPVPSIEPNPVAFGAVLLGAVSAEVAVTVANKGAGKLTPGAASLGGEHVADFTFVADNCNGKTLLGEQSCSIVLRFSPASAGARGAVLNVPGVGTVNLTGTGTSPTAPPATTPTTTPTATPTTTPPGGGPTPTTPPTTPPATAPPGTGAPAGTPTIRLSRPLGAPGEVIMIEGTGFRPNAQVTLRWLMNPLDPLGRTIVIATVTTDGAGSFAATPAVVFLNDPSGPRVAEATSGADQTATAPFLVVPATMQRSDNEALHARRTQLLYRR